MDKQKVIEYLMHTPYNTNLAVLKPMLGEGDWSRLLNYVRQTSYNMNRRVLEGLLNTNTSTAAIVGIAKVGEAVVG